MRNELLACASGLAGIPPVAVCRKALESGLCPLFFMSDAQSRVGAGLLPWPMDVIDGDIGFMVGRMANG